MEQNQAGARTENNEAAQERLILVVVGAHLQAEAIDRPLGYRLREEILRWRDERAKREQDDDAAIGQIQPIVCTDVWYLNDESLRSKPTICVGPPAVNAASAYLANRLPTAFLIENTLRVHLDTEFIDQRACIWGVDQAATSAGVDLFVSRYLNEFMEEALGPPG
ncbi:MAG: hypothetical protein L0Y44_04165 [Phycisphaerales bacterium]|nr:hypothetical protein [Phycisphaerales bacterium]MCI0629833.1 hypothetical protein [Phycisphaerales bacterium]